MTVGEAEKAICVALEYCHGHSCCECPKAVSCDYIFDIEILEDAIRKLAEKCKEFNGWD